MQEEREEPTQRSWHSRLERERLNLSASVEVALRDGASQERQWEWVADGQDELTHTAGGTALIPPRLSLQSRVMPSVQPGKPDTYKMYMHSNARVSGESEAQKSVPVTTQHVSVFARLAQRLTSSLTAFRLPAASPPPSQMSAAVVMPSSAVKQEVEQQEKTEPRKPAVSLPLQGQASVATMQPFEQRSPTVLPAPPPLSVSSVALPALPAQDDEETVEQPAVKLEQVLPGHTFHRQRLGRVTRVRLEAAPEGELPAAQQASSAQEESKPREEAVVEPPKGIVSGNEARPEIKTSAHLPAFSFFTKGKGLTSARLPAIFQGEFSANKRNVLSGAGAFESGQRDVIVKNSHITDASVVLVTLTSNPGPVVVQYITLQPRIGFTVHLTAPASARTPFNYVILLGELF